MDINEPKELTQEELFFSQDLNEYSDYCIEHGAPLKTSIDNINKILIKAKRKGDKNRVRTLTHWIGFAKKSYQDAQTHLNDIKSQIEQIPPKNDLFKRLTGWNEYIQSEWNDYNNVQRKRANIARDCRMGYDAYVGDFSTLKCRAHTILFNIDNAKAEKVNIKKCITKIDELHAKRKELVKHIYKERVWV